MVENNILTWLSYFQRSWHIFRHRHSKNNKNTFFWASINQSGWSCFGLTQGAMSSPPPSYCGIMNCLIIGRKAKCQFLFLQEMWYGVCVCVCWGEGKYPSAFYATLHSPASTSHWPNSTRKPQGEGDWLMQSLWLASHGAEQGGEWVWGADLE